MVAGSVSGSTPQVRESAQPVSWNGVRASSVLSASSKAGRGRESLNAHGLLRRGRRVKPLLVREIAREPGGPSKIRLEAGKRERTQISRNGTSEYLRTLVGACSLLSFKKRAI